MIASFGLANEPGALGLRCSPEGLSLVGAPLLRKTATGFAPRPAHEVAALIDAAYGADPTRLLPSLGLIAEALNRGELARAMIAAVMTRTPELSREAAARVAKADARLAKFDPNQPRDGYGRWTSDGGVRPAPVASAHWEDEAKQDRSRAAAALVAVFENKYDDLGPVEFSKEVIQFGDRLGREGKSLSPEAKERALAEYAFLQDRLSFWLDYDYKPATAHANLISAALTLFQGANLGGLVHANEVPRSMLDVAGAAWALDNASPSVRYARELGAGREAVTPGKQLTEFDGTGIIVDKGEAPIVWGPVPKAQGEPWEVYLARLNAEAKRQASNAKAFDLFNETTGEAISAKTMSTLSVGYIKNPQRIYNKMHTYIGEAADYTARVPTDVDPDLIKSKTLQLAVPEYTSSTQWRYLHRAIRYGRSRGVRVIITRIRE